MRKPGIWQRKGRGFYSQIGSRQYYLGRDQAEAEKKWHRLMAGEGLIEATDLPVSVLADMFLDWTEQRFKPLTYDFYLYFLQSFKDRYPSIRTSALKPYHVQAWIDAQKEWSQATRSNAVKAMKRLFNWGREDGPYPRESDSFSGSGADDAAGADARRRRPGSHDRGGSGGIPGSAPLSARSRVPSGRGSARSRRGTVISTRGSSSSMSTRRGGRPACRAFSTSPKRWSHSVASSASGTRPGKFSGDAESGSRRTRLPNGSSRSASASGSKRALCLRAASWVCDDRAGKRRRLPDGRRVSWATVPSVSWSSTTVTSRTTGNGCERKQNGLGDDEAIAGLSQMLEGVARRLTAAPHT